MNDQTVAMPKYPEKTECQKMSDLIFEPIAHTYTLAGKIMPSVTQIINAVIPRTFDPDPWYMQRGTMVHRAVALMLRGELDEESVDQRIAGYVAAANSFLSQQPMEFMKFADHVLETPLCDPKRGFAGTPDLVTDGCIIDWKSGSAGDEAELQTGAYAVLTSPIAPRRRKLMAVVLYDTGKYAVLHYDERRSYGLFLNVFSVYQWMQKNGRLPKGE